MFIEINIIAKYNLKIGYFLNVTGIKPLFILQ